MNNLGSTLKDVAKYNEALKWLKKGAERLGHNAAAYSNVLFTLFGYELETHQDRYKEAIKFGEKFKSNNHERWRDRILLPQMSKKLRVGFVSPDFCRHAVSYFIEPLLEEWKQQEDIEIYLYAAGNVRDDYSERLKLKADSWRDITNSADEIVVRQIVQDEIDILIDLAGHTAGNRLTIFAHKPAPIQATYLGYYGTTGLKEIDYWITDNTIHQGQDCPEKSSEEKWILKRSYVTYRPIKKCTRSIVTPYIEKKSTNVRKL